MSRASQTIRIVVADDDADDRLLIREAFEECRIGNPIDFVEDGEALMDYLRALPDDALPGMILLDLNMPRKDGRSALREIRADARLRCIPVIVLTTSKSDEDIAKTYSLGVSSFIAKPVSFDGLIEVIRALAQFWFEIVLLPPECRRQAG